MSKFITNTGSYQTWSHNVQHKWTQDFSLRKHSRIILFEMLQGQAFSLLFWLLHHICELQKDFLYLCIHSDIYQHLRVQAYGLQRKFRWMNATSLFYFFSFLCSFGLLQQDKPDEISLLLSATSLILLNSCWFIMHSSHQVCEGTISLMLDATANHYKCIEKP